MKVSHFREIKKVYMVVVLEGNGTEENVSREVRYFYDDDTDTLLGKVDPYMGQFMECDTCAAKPGSPTLCKGCLHNRTVIGH